MGVLSRHKKEREKARVLYESVGSIHCPYFNKEVIYNARGFHHLQYSAGSERSKLAQIRKFTLLSKSVDILRQSGTVQQYRKQFGVVGRKKGKSGHREMKEMQYWGFEGILGSNNDMIRVKVVVRQVGDGPFHFWSVMSDIDVRRKSSYKFATDDVLDG